MNKEKFSRLTAFFTTSAFTVFIFLACVVFVLSEKESYSFFENRNLAVFPKLSKESVESGTYFSDIDTYITEHAPGRRTVLKASAYTDMNLLHRPVVNDVVVCSDVLLPYNEYEIVDEEQIAYNADIISSKLKIHADLTESYGGYFCYTAVPCQYVCYENKYPSYLNNRHEYTQKSSSALFERLDMLDVNYIDMYSYFVNAGRPDYFTSTIDNHYSILGAYDTYMQIMNKIISETDFKPSVLYESDFTLTRLPNKYLGSRTRKLFGMWKSDESLFTITPNVNVSFDRWNWGGYPGASTVYTLPQNEGEDVLYTMYMNGDISDTVIKTYRDELPSILIYGDSFTNAVECIAWYSFDTMYSIDFRHYTEKTLDEFIEEFKPDIVVCIRDYEALLSSDYNGR